MNSTVKKLLQIEINKRNIIVKRFDLLWFC